MMKKRIVELMNEQVKNEFESGYLYLSMAAYFHEQNLDGMGTWMRVQAHEEWVHGMKFVNHLIERGAEVKLQDLKQHKVAWKSVEEAWADALEHEKFITGTINALMQAAREEQDYAAEPLLNWFLEEQIEEEANASKNVAMIQRVKSSPNGLHMLDGKLSARSLPEVSPFK